VLVHTSVGVFDTMLWYQNELPDADEWKLVDFNVAWDSAIVDVTFKGIRYHLLLSRNKKVSACAENDVILAPEASQATLDEQNVQVSSVCKKMLQLYGRHLSLWLLPGSDSSSASPSELDVARLAGYYNGFPYRRQLRTVRGELLSVNPAKHYMRMHGHPVPNQFPGLPVFTKDRLVVKCRPELDDGISLVEAARDANVGGTAAGDLLVMKTVYRCWREDIQDFIREADVLGKIPSHPNIVGFHGLVVDGDGFVDGILVSYLDGTLLPDITQATLAERERWKSQINAALSHVHNQVDADGHRSPVAWGDAKAGNVMITAAGDAVILDFGGGWTYDGVEKKDENTVATDEKGREMIMNLLDNLPPPGEGAVIGGTYGSCACFRHWPGNTYGCRVLSDCLVQERLISACWFVLHVVA